MIGNLDDYVCTIPERRTLLNPYLHRKNRKFVPVADAEQGKFIIVFNVEDKAGNKANHVYRTVIVKDTLPPVITLHLKNKLVHTSGTTLGANGQYSPKDHGINHKMIGGAKGRISPLSGTPPPTPRVPTARTPVAPPVPTVASATLICRTASSWPKSPPPTAGSSA